MAMNSSDESRETNRQLPASLPEFETLTFAANDGYRLSGRKFAASGPPKGQLIVASATGVPQGFYRSFAQYASGRGFTTLTFDYRGIGDSKPATLKGFRIDYLDWARLDLAAAVSAMHSNVLPLFIVGHSFGGHAFGLLPNYEKVDRLYTFGTGAGWHGWMPFGERLKVLLMWRVIGPLITGVKGYLAWKKLGFGEDLPLGVYTQWKRWCRFPRYFFDDPLTQDLASLFERVRTPIIAANSLDDLWALPRSRDAFVSGYKNASIERVDLNPEAFGMSAIGHMGYFRPNAQALWKVVIDWFESAQ